MHSVFVKWELPDKLRGEQYAQGANKEGLKPVQTGHAIHRAKPKASH